MKWKFCNMGLISDQKHEMEICQYGINIYPKMKWKFGNVGSISIQKHEMEMG